MYQWLDRAPKGRNETGVWWRNVADTNLGGALSLIHAGAGQTLMPQLPALLSADSVS